MEGALRNGEVNAFGLKEVLQLYYPDWVTEDLLVEILSIVFAHNCEVEISLLQQVDGIGERPAGYDHFIPFAFEVADQVMKHVDMGRV
jgi:hypothetical protein